MDLELERAAAPFSSGPSTQSTLKLANPDDNAVADDATVRLEAPCSPPAAGNDAETILNPNFSDVRIISPILRLFY